MANATRADVLIVGGGLTGLSLSCALAGAGLSVVLVDRMDPIDAAAPRYDGRTTAVALSSRRILEAIGVWSGVSKVACPIDEIRVSDGDSPLFLHFDHREVGDAPFGYIVENRHLRQALSSRASMLENLTVHAPASVVSLDRGAHRVSARLDDRSEIVCALVAGCDGRNSKLRQDARIPVTAWRYEQKSIVCTALHARPHRNVAQERFLPSGPFAILPMNDDGDGRHRSSIVWTEDADVAPALVALDEAAFVGELDKRFGDFLGDLAVAGGRWCHDLGFMHAASYTAQRLALLGDAAHVIHPIAGQGLNLGWRDVAVLAETLVDVHRLGLDIGAASVLDRCERWRRFDNATLAAVTDVLNRLFSNNILPVRVVRDLGLAVVDRLPPLKRQFMRHAMGIVGDLPRLARGEAL